MSITREQVSEQVADLQPGDVVRIVEVESDGSRYVHEGPVRADGGNALEFAGLWLRSGRGEAPDWVHELTVVSRAPRLYVNHPRTEPVPGDVVRDADNDGVRDVWIFADPSDPASPWRRGRDGGDCWCGREGLPARLRLLVDGETGQVVP